MRALVTGGGGFLGGAIVRRLIERGDAVVSLSRGDHLWLREIGVETVRADVADADAVSRAARGCDLVFHVAAKAALWGPVEEFRRANVAGTANVVAACRTHGIGRLVFTSSPSVVGSGADLEGVDESVPYPDRHESTYSATKAEAEKLVLAANDDRLATVAIRPHLVWGPGDNHLLPRIVARARSGRLRRIGTRPCPVDTTYIDNAADAHLLAADRLEPGSAIAGKAYFLSQGEPIPLWEMINRMLAAAGEPPVERSIPPALAWFAGAVCETAYAALGRTDEPPMTRFLAHQLSTAHWFDIGAARRDLGYVPTVSTEEGLRRLATWIADRGQDLASIIANSGRTT